MQELLLSSINGLIFSFFIYQEGKIIYDKQSYNKTRLLSAVIIYVMSFVINIYYFTPLFTVFFHYISIVIFQKIVFEATLTETLLGAILTYVIRRLLEIILVLLPFFHSHTIFCLSFSTEKFISNFISAIFALLFVIIFRKKIQITIKRITSYDNCGVVVLSIVYIVLIIGFLILVPYIERNYNLVCDAGIMFMLAIVTIIIINQEQKMSNLYRMYNEIAIYNKASEDLLEEYRLTLHEEKNRLLVIEHLLSENKKEAERYVKSLLNEKEKLTYEWLNELKNIPIAGLKGFVASKMAEMKEKGIKAEVMVSPELSVIPEIPLNNVKDLYSIMGILLDNALEAASESFDKMVSIHMYKTDNLIHIEVANTFSNKIDLDKLNMIGYTTKGRGRGTGLALVSKIIDDNHIYNLHTDIFQNFFVQDLVMVFDQKT